MRVIVADDHAMVRRGVRRLLEIAGMTVVAEAGDGVATILLSIEHCPDVLILDLGMPALNGFEVISRLRFIDHRTAIVVLTAYDDPSYVLRATAMGVRAYVLKSSTDEDLIPAIQAATGGDSFFSSGLSIVRTRAEGFCRERL